MALGTQSRASDRRLELCGKLESKLVELVAIWDQSNIGSQPL